MANSISKYVSSIFISFLFCVNGAMALDVTKPVTKPVTKVLEASQFSLISLNLYNRPINRNDRMDASADILKTYDADIIALQEVSQGWFLGKNPVDTINKSIAYHRQDFFFENAPPVWQNGLTVLSRWPVETVRNSAFDVNRFFNIKGFQHVRVKAPFGDIELINLHMAATQRHSIKAPEFEQLIQYIDSLSSPVIVLGDFNERRNSELIPLITEKNNRLASIYNVLDLEHKNTHAGYGGSCLGVEGSRLDYVFFDHTGYQLTSGDILNPYNEPPISDHCVISTRFKRIQ